MNRSLTKFLSIFLLTVCLCNFQTFAVYPWDICDESEKTILENWEPFYWLRDWTRESKKLKLLMDRSKKMITHRPLRQIIKINGPICEIKERLNVDKIEYINSILHEYGNEKLYIFLGSFFDDYFFDKFSGFFHPHVQWNIAASINGTVVNDKLTKDVENYEKSISKELLNECIETSPKISSIEPCDKRSMVISKAIFESLYYMDYSMMIKFFDMAFVYFFNTRTENVPEMFCDVYSSLVGLSNILEREIIGYETFITVRNKYRAFCELKEACDPTSSEFRGRFVFKWGI